MARTTARRCVFAAARTAAPLALAAVGIALTACAQRPAIKSEELGDRAYERGRLVEARDYYLEAVNTRPGHWPARIGLARVLLDMGEPGYAREQMEIVYAVQPQNDEVVRLLARSMLESGDIRGMDALLRGIAETTGDADDWRRLGVFLAEAGDADNAETALLTAARISQGRDAATQTALGDFYAGVGDEDAALNRYAAALFLDPTLDDVKDAVRALGEVPGPTFADPAPEYIPPAAQ